MARLKQLLSTIKKLMNERQIVARYKVVSLNKDQDDQHTVIIQVTNKNVTFTRKPDEILADDSMLDQFSQKDIRTLTYLGYLNINSPKYKILAKFSAPPTKSIID